MSDKHFVEFSKPFLDALTETFKMMVQTDIKAHSPTIKSTRDAHGDISAMIGMNGEVIRDGETKEFKGLLVLSWPEELYVKLAGRMLFEEYEEYCEEIEDSGAEICNIVMGNAKNGLVPLGYKIAMATPTTVRGKNHSLKYVPNSTVIGITISTDLGDFMLELCYQESTLTE